MINSKTFENILEKNFIGFAFLSSELKITLCNKIFSEFIDTKKNCIGESIYTSIPETIGLEEEIQSMLFTSKNQFILPNLNRIGTEDQIKYYNLNIYSTGEAEYPIVCVVINVSENTSLKQKINQQRNEILLLESVLESKNDFLTGSILGESLPIKKLRTMIQKISNITTATILLQGESGTGKNLVARVIHYSSQGQGAPFVEINCAAIPENLLESELFGYEKGAFTHAVSSKPGLLEKADGGTIFLDEIGEMPLNLQAKLLTFLENKKFRRLGSTIEKEVQVRLIAATNRYLPELVKNSQFRGDLFYRLNIINLTTPPLREMGNDLLVISNHFVKFFNMEFKKHIKGFTKDGEKKLLLYPWPGNVRELSNCIERAMIFAENESIDSNDIIIEAENSMKSDDKWSLPAEGISLTDLEQELIKSALNRSGGNKTKAAQLLGLSRDTLRYRLEKYNLE